ncbi:MAG: response regulator transcription factor [Dehalococcoidia bacterium]
MTEPIRVMLADDHAVLRAGLRALLNAEPDIEVVGEAGDGQEAVALAERLKPDIVVMDITMPRMDGLMATRQIAARLPETRVLILTMHTEDQYLLQVLEAGGAGYVLKRSADTELMNAIRVVHRGEVYLYPSATKMLLEAYRTGERPGEAREQVLTDREEEVLKLTAEGYSNTEIAGRIYLSPKTVDTYRQRIMEKLGLHHRAELVRYALDRGLLRPSQ